jgi:predicted dehydrogenase
LCDDADRAGVTLMVAAPRLYDPYVAYVTDALDHGRLGAISLISTVWRMSLPAVYRRLTAQPRHRAVTTRPGSVEWLAQRLCDESIHHLGVVARWTAGPLRPQSVALTERAFQITLHADDVVVTHSNVTPSGHGETFTVYGEGGRMEAAAWSPHFPHVGGRVTAESAGDGQVTHPAIARANPYWLQIREFVDVIRGVRAPRRVARAAVDDLATIEAVIGHAATALASTTVEGRA